LWKCPRTGPIVELETGRRLGDHRGTWFYTIGQRRGLGLSGGPWFVVDKDPGENTVFVSHRLDLESHARSEFEVTRLHWIGDPPAAGATLTAKLRHGPSVVGCSIETGRDPDHRRVRIERADAGIAPGQFAIFYDGDHCLGGGVIAGAASESRRAVARSVR